MSSEIDLAEIKRRMDSSVEVLAKDFAGLRTARANPAMLESLLVDAYGGTMPLNQCASVNAPESRLLTIQVWDASLSKAVERAIRDSDLDLNPQAEGQTLRIPVPELNEERRRDLAKVAAKYTESARVSVRNVRRDGMDLVKKAQKAGEISEDEMHRLNQQIQSETDSRIKQIDSLYTEKEKDILTV